MFDTAKSFKAIARIKTGGVAELSRSQIINLIVNMLDARKKLPYDQYRAVSDLYDYYRKFKTKETMDLEKYREVCKEIISDLDHVAPFDVYCGELDVELMVLKEIRAGR